MALILMGKITKRKPQASVDEHSNWSPESQFSCMQSGDDEHKHWKLVWIQWKEDRQAHLAETSAHSCSLLKHVAQDVAGFPNDKIVWIQAGGTWVKHLQLLGMPDWIRGGVCKAMLPQALAQEGVSPWQKGHLLSNLLWGYALWQTARCSRPLSVSNG